MEDLQQTLHHVLVSCCSLGILDLWNHSHLVCVKVFAVLQKEWWLTVCRIVVFSVVIGVLFTSPPYNFTVGQAGLTSLSPFILCVLGEAISGPLNDWICVKLTKRNHGIYEPEFRLVLMGVVVILGTVGFFGFGLTVHNVTHWSGPVLTYGLANMSLAFASTCVFGYVLDCYPRLAEEAFTAINTRNLLTFGLVSRFRTG